MTVTLALVVAAVTASAQWLGVRDGAFPGDRALLVTTAYVVMLLGTVALHFAASCLPPRRPAIRLRSREDRHHDAVIFPAPGAVVLVDMNSLVGIGG